MSYRPLDDVCYAVVRQLRCRWEAPLAYSFLVSELTYEVCAGTVRAAGTLIYDYTPK